MPAPTPIQIRYGGDPATLGGLAFSAGTARRRQADYQSQLANDRAFLQNELSRRTEDTRFRNNANLSLLGMQANERAARAQASALQEASGYNQRQAAQAGGVANAGARGSGQPIRLVPAEGPLGGEQSRGGGYVDFYDRDDPDGAVQRFFSKDGKLTRFGGGELGPDERGGFVGPGPQRGVPMDVRTTLDYIEGLRGIVPETKLNAMRVSARQGLMGLPEIKSLVDDIRARSGGGKDFEPGRLSIRQARTKLFDMDRAMENSDPKVQQEAMLRQLNIPVGSREATWALAGGGVKLKEVWSLRYAEMKNMARPIDSRGPALRGKSGSRENPLQLTHPSQVEGLAPGTYFFNNDGERMQRQ